MIKNIIISVTLLLTSLYSYSQSYIGFCGGMLQPMAYRDIPNSHEQYYPYPSNIIEKPSFYISTFIKERLARRFNFGFSFSISYLDLEFNTNESGKVYSSYSDIKFTSYRLYTQLDLEISVYKKFLFLNFGPEIEIPINAYFYENGFSYEFSGYYEYNREGKHESMLSPGVFVGLSLEKKITENKIFFIRSQISFTFARVYQGIRTSDFIIGAGIQFFLPKFTIGKKNKNTGTEQSYILEKN